MYNLVSFAGIFILMAFAWTLSADRRVVNWRVVIWGCILQMIFALFIFVVPAGANVFMFINDALVKVIDVASAGTKFIFGRLALPPGTTNEWGEESLGFIFAVQVLPQIIFFASLMAVLYYMGVMSWLVKIFARIFTKLMKVSGAESLCASSNIFVGIESATTIRPYIERMTRSELCTILTAGMATIASTVLAIYILILRKQFPTIAGHLVSASFLSAPAAIIMSKLLLPETETPETLGMDVKPYYEKESSVIEAVINGANAGLKLAVGVVALLIAFLGLVALVDFIFTGAGLKLNNLIGMNIDWSLKGLLGYVFYPFTLIIGVPPSDAFEISKIIGERSIVTETKSYMDLADLLAKGALHDPRSAFLATYALCGFAHVASLAIFVGGIAALVPKRTADLSAVGPRALLAATLACLMTAAVAGTFFKGGSILLGQ
ncbi:MAG TPA: nucleoside transporter [Nitrospirae bacterium]|nr:nucleoside permease NupX [bacterium BMS3Abin06]HDH11711.1 nucleoside transporter [Nitrospirota bacterium]HDZ03213.1 nucleoside transporter [Nitrospirota bacterium]